MQLFMEFCIVFGTIYVIFIVSLSNFYRIIYSNIIINYILKEEDVFFLILYYRSYKWMIISSIIKSIQKLGNTNEIFFKKIFKKNIKYYRKCMFNQHLWMSFMYLLIRAKYIFIFLPVKRYYVTQKR